MNDVNEMHNGEAETAQAPPRRSFLYKAATVTIGVLVGLVPALAALLPVLDPVRRSRGGKDGGDGDAATTGGGGWFPVVGADALPADGSPQQFPVFADKVDAWNTIRNTRVGAVYLRKQPDGSVAAWNVVCPHAGCYVAAQNDGSFICPCHDSEFNPDGSRREVNRHGEQTKSPRAMDALEAKVEAGRVFVKFKNFQAAVADKNPIHQSIRPPRSA